jgi:hypothetical protein
MVYVNNVVDANWVAQPAAPQEQPATQQPVVQNPVVSDLDNFSKNFDPKALKEEAVKEELTPEQKAAIDQWKDALANPTNQLGDDLMEQLQKWATVKEILQGKDSAQQMQILQRLWLLNEDVILPDPNKSAAEEELQKRDNDSLVAPVQQEEKKVDIGQLKELLAKSKEGSIFNNETDKSNPEDKAEVQPTDERVTALEAEKAQLEEKVNGFSAEKQAWLVEKQALAARTQELEFELWKEKRLIEKYSWMVTDYQTNTDLVSISDPFVRQLNEKIGQHKEAPSREWALEVLYKISDVVKNITGGLDMSSVIQEYDKVTKSAPVTQPVNAYNYETAKDLNNRKAPSAEDKNPNIPKGQLGRSV